VRARVARTTAAGLIVAASSVPSWLHAPGVAVPPPATAAFQWRLPAGFPAPLVPAANPMSEAKVALGRLLFYDTRLSGNQTFSCASCHQQSRAFTDGRAQATGSTGAAHPRSSMALANVAYNSSLGWADHRLRTLEDQMAVPMFNEHPVELGIKGRETEIAARFAPEEALFAAAFPGASPTVRFEHIVKAIAAFERTLISGESAFDDYLYRDDKSGMSESARRGMKLFFSDRLACGRCHSGFNLSGPVMYQGSRPAPPTFHNTALYNVDGRGAYPDTDRGIFDITHKPRDMGRFRAPTLRNIALTAPYMHDGSVPTLEAAVAHYAAGGVGSPLRTEHMKGFRVLPADVADLVAFLNTLTDRKFVTNPAFAAPK
jgi:cytochrome c peroxidase